LVTQVKNSRKVQNRTFTKSFFYVINGYKLKYTSKDTIKRFVFNL
jgi:hypothetical protein